MKKITAIVNHKGGVGKTAISTNLAFAISERGYKTLLVDLDPQGHSCIIFCDQIDDDNNISNVIKDRSYNISKAIVEAKIQGEVVENLYILPSDLNLSLTEVEIYGRTRFEKLLQRQLNKISDDFDYVIIDCPPNLGPLTQNAIFCSTNILVPINYDNFALRGVKTLFGKVNEVKEDQWHYSLTILRNKRDVRDKKMTNSIEEELSNNIPSDYIMKTILRKASVLEQSRIDLEPVSIHAPKSAIKKDYDDLAEEYINE